MTRVGRTIACLRARIDARAAGYSVSFTTDPAWLVDQSINRRAGWLDDPTTSRGSCRPVAGRYPKKAEGDAQRHLGQLARRINTPRVIVRPSELGEWRGFLLERIPERFTWPQDE